MDIEVLGLEGQAQAAWGSYVPVLPVVESL
jgi:hypothetical protein